MELLAILAILFLDFALTALGIWVITIILSTFGLAITFSWGLAFGVWVIMRIIKMIF